MINKIKIIFFGTPEFAQIILDKLLKADYSLTAVVTAPDKAVGRKQILTPKPVKILAKKNNLPVLQPEKLDNDFINQLKKFSADLFIVAAYGKIIPKNILDIPKFGCLNVHPSFLPKYRGASPVQSALLNGEHETGVTIILMDEKMDHGPIIAQSSKLKIKSDEKFSELQNRLANLSAELLIKIIPDYLSAKKIKPVPQNESLAIYCKIIKKEDGYIDWSKSAQQIYNQWRAFYSWPGIFSQLTINNRQLIIKFIEIESIDIHQCCVSAINKKPGKFFINNKKLYITCDNNSVLEIKKLQPEGKKVMSAKEFINGYLIH